MPNNLPNNLTRHTPYQESTYTHELIFEDAYTMPTVVTAELRRGGQKKVGLEPAVEIQGKKVIFTYSREKLAKLKGLNEHYFFFDDQPFLGGELNVVIGYGTPTSNQTPITVQNGIPTIIQIPGLTQVAGLTERAEVAANNAESSEVNAVSAETAAQNFATTAGQEAGIAQDMADAAIDAKNLAVTAKNAAVTARNQAEALRNETQQIKEGVEATLPVTVATYADAVPLFTGDVFRRIDVVADTAYNEGEPSFYEYKPAMPTGKKVWFLGLDPDYLTNV